MENNFRAKAAAILFGQSVSHLTSAILQMAIAWHITLETGSAIMLTLATLSGFMPQAFLGSFAGAIIDRYQKKKVIIFSDLFIGIASLVLAVLAFSDNMPIYAILIILIIRSLCTAFHEPSTQALTPLIVPKEYIMKYAGYSQMIIFLSFILSPSLAIVLYNNFHIGVIMALDTLGALFAIAILLCIKFPKENLDAINSKKPNIIAETKEGFAFLRKQEGMVALLVLGVLYSCIYSPVGSLYPNISLVYFEATTTQSGIVEMIVAVGSLLGSFTLGKLANKIPKIKGISTSILVYGIVVFSIGWLPQDGFLVFAMLSFALGFTVPFYHGINQAIYQLTIPQEYLGRSFAVMNSTRKLGMPLGLILGSVFADSVGINKMFIIGGALAIVLSLIIAGNKSFKRFH